jgi:protein gp37
MRKSDDARVLPSQKGKGMAENSGIEWTTHTFNPWIGCTKVSAACDHCYAEAWDKRFDGSRWGPHAARTRTKTWGNPVKWNKQAAETGERPRVFCASLADVFDNHKSIDPAWRRELWLLIRDTPHLDWLLLTKRPQNIAKMLPDDWGNGYANVWLGVSTENREEMLRRGKALAEIPARVTFWSAEPLVGDLGEIPAEIMPSWVITGGENGTHYRPVNPDWFRSLRDQCASRGVPFLFKQWEGRNQREIKAKGRALDGVVHDGYPA